MTDIDAIRARHILIVPWDDASGCVTCGDPWPCDTAVVLAALDGWTDRASCISAEAHRFIQERDAAREELSQEGAKRAAIEASLMGEITALEVELDAAKMRYDDLVRQCEKAVLFEQSKTRTVAAQRDALKEKYGEPKEVA